MSRIDFAFGARHRLLSACEVVHKHYLAGHKVLVYTQDTARMTRFNQLLWGHESTAFIPHVFEDHSLASETPVILIKSRPDQWIKTDKLPWLLNLDLSCPPGYEAFPRILELVSEHEQDKTAARQRWRAYQSAGHDVRAHSLG